MSFYSYSILTAAKTGETTKKKTPMILGPGVIHWVRIRIPPGSQGLLHCHVNHHVHQIIPSNDDGNFFGDDEIIEYDEFYELKAPLTTVDAYTWNDDTEHDHTMILQFGVLPKWVLLPQLFAQQVSRVWEGVKTRTWR